MGPECRPVVSTLELVAFTYNTANDFCGLLVEVLNCLRAGKAVQICVAAEKTERTGERSAEHILDCFLDEFSNTLARAASGGESFQTEWSGEAYGPRVCCHPKQLRFLLVKRTKAAGS